MGAIKDFIVGAYTDSQYKGTAVDALDRAGGNTRLWGAFMLSMLIILCIVYKKDEKVNKRIIIPYVIVPVIMMFVNLNPVFTAIMIKVNENDVYWRVYWLIPSVIIIAIAITLVIFQIEKKFPKMVAFVLAIFCIYNFGGLAYGVGEPRNVSNFYKLPDYEVEMIQTISADEGDYKKLCGPNEFQIHTRQIDANIICAYDRFMHEIPQSTMVYDIYQGDSAKIFDKAIKKRVNYIIMDHENENEEDPLTNYGFEIIKTNDKYTLYKIDIDKAIAEKEAADAAKAAAQANKTKTKN